MALTEGTRVFLCYDLPAPEPELYHERYILSACACGQGFHIILTPDFETYAEQISLENQDITSFRIGLVDSFQQGFMLGIPTDFEPYQTLICLDSCEEMLPKLRRRCRWLLGVLQAWLLQWLCPSLLLLQRPQMKFGFELNPLLNMLEEMKYDLMARRSCMVMLV